MAYRQQEHPLTAHEVLFDDLLPETQARLARASQQPHRWCILAEHRAPAVGATHGLILCALVALAAALALAAGYGDLSFDDIARRDRRQGALGAALGLSLLGAGLSLRAQRRARGQAFRPGVYLFGRELVDARRRRLRLLCTGALGSISAEGDRLALSFRGGARHTLPGGAFGPEQAALEIDDLRAQIELAEERGDRAELDRLDPFTSERPRWASGHRGAPWWRRWRALWLAAAVAPAGALLACGAGRAWAVEQAVRQGDFGRLAWFAVSERWLNGWADRRWREAALASPTDAFDLYLQISPRRAGFERELPEHLDLCFNEDTSAGCGRVLRAHCRSGAPSTPRLREAFERIDSRTRERIKDSCWAFVGRNWAVSELSRAQVRHAVERKDVDTLDDFGAIGERQALYDAEIEKLQKNPSPTARALALALAGLRDRHNQLFLRVTRAPNDRPEAPVEHGKPGAWAEWRKRAAALVQQELRALPCGRLLRIKTLDHDDDLRQGLELQVALESKPFEQMGKKILLQAATWTVQEMLAREVYLEGWLGDKDLKSASFESFREEFVHPRPIKAPWHGLPEADELNLTRRLR